MSMHVSLGAYEAFAREKVAQGEYASEEEVVQEGMRLLQERDARWEREFCRKVEEGIAAADAGKLIPAEEVFAELEARLAKLQQKAAE